jgi:hypothetical protein
MHLSNKKEGCQLDCASYPSVCDDDIQFYLSKTQIAEFSEDIRTNPFFYDDQVQFYRELHSEAHPQS